MSSNWSSGNGKDRNWFIDDPEPIDPPADNRARTDSRLADTRPIGQSTAALAQSQIQIAALFQNLRQVLGRSYANIAIELDTSPDVIEALETGRFDALPSWPETSRVVTSYTNLAGIDPSPALHVLKRAVSAPHPRIQDQVTVAKATVAPTTQRSQAGAGMRTHPQATGPTRTITSTSAPVDSLHPNALQNERTTPGATQPPQNWRRGRSGTPVPTSGSPTPLRTDIELDEHSAVSNAVAARLAQMWNALKGSFNLERTRAILSVGSADPSSPKTWLSRRLVFNSVGLAIGLLVILAGLSSPAVARFANANLPGPLATAFMSVHSILSPPKIYMRNGMRWIEVSDPRTRRTDKLPTRDE